MTATALPAGSLPDNGASRWASLLLDAGGCVQQSSRRVAAIFGRRAEQLSGWTIQALIPALPLQPATPGYNLAFVTFWHCDPGRPPLWGVDSKGDRLALDVDMQRFRREPGRAAAPLIRLMVRCRAVAGRAERGAADLDRFLRAVAGCVEGVVVTDAQGSIVHLNRSAECMIGCPSERLRGIALAQVFAAAPGSIPRSEVPAIWRRTGGGSATCTQVEATTRPFVDRFGAVTHEVHTLHDISGRGGAQGQPQRLARGDGLPAVHADRVVARPQAAMLPTHAEEPAHAP